METLDELVEVISAINSRDTWDYVEIIVSMALSAIAIIISIWVAIRQNQIGKKQNDIALFEQRYKAINVLCILLPVARAVLLNYERGNPEYGTMTILKSSMQTYKYSKHSFDVEASIDFRQVKWFYDNLILEVGSLSCIFKKKHSEQTMSFLRAFSELVSNVYDGKSVDKEMNLLEDCVSQIDEKKVIEKLERYITL